MYFLLIVTFTEHLEQNDRVHAEQHHETSSQSHDCQSLIHNSYQVFLVYPIKESVVHEKWYYFLSVSLKHPLFIKVSVNYESYNNNASQTTYPFFHIFCRILCNGYVKYIKVFAGTTDANVIWRHVKKT